MKLAIVIADSNSACPVPAVKGGAVATLVEHLVKTNNIENMCSMEVISYYHKDAVEQSKKYENIHFHWIKTPYFITIADSVAFFLIRTFFKKKKAISYKHIFSLAHYIVCVSWYLKKQTFDKVVIENNMMLSWIIRLNGNHKKYKEKYYYHLHNIPRINAKCKEILNGASAFLCVSNYVGNRIQSSKNVIGPVDADKIRIVKNCIDLEQYQSEEPSEAVMDKYRAKYNLAKNDQVIVFVGRLSREKGVDQVIKALEFLPSNTKLLVVGATLSTGRINDSFSLELKQLSGKYKSRIIYIGYVSQSEMQYIYRLGKFAVLPSMWDEPAGLTMIEAMACGTVVITTNAGGIPEYTEEGASILLDRNTELPKMIAQKIMELTEDKEKYNRISKSGQEYVHHNFSLDCYLDNFIIALGD